MIKTKTLKKIVISTAIGFGVLLAITGLSELIFGDLTAKDTFLPAIIAVPIMAIIVYLILKND